MTARDLDSVAAPFDGLFEYLGTYATDEDSIRFNVTVFAMPTWPRLAFVMHDGDPAHDAYRVVRGLDCVPFLERLSADLRSSGGGSVGWTEVGAVPLSINVEVFQRHVAAVPEEDLLEWLRDAATIRVADAEDLLDRCHERAERLALLVLKAERRCAALAIVDPIARGIAVRMAEEWKGTAGQLVQVAAGIAEPVPAPDSDAPAPESGHGESARG